MCFLVTDIGHEDILLSYPWLATFGPKFNWNNTIIEANALPIIFLSTHPNDTCTVIPSSQTEEEKLAIMKQLSKQTTIQGITTELAIKAGEWKRKTKIPKLYKHHFHPPDHGTMPLHSNQTLLTLFHAKFIQWHKQKTRGWKNSSRSNMQRAIYACQSHHMHHPSILSRRGRIITTLTAIQLRINIPYPSCLTSQQALVEPTYSQSLTSDGVTTMYTSRREMSIRLCLKPSMDLQWCFSVSVIPHPHFKQWWTGYFGHSLKNGSCWAQRLENTWITSP